VPPRVTARNMEQGIPKVATVNDLFADGINRIFSLLSLNSYFGTLVRHHLITLSKAAKLYQIPCLREMVCRKPELRPG